jgi:putative NADH-flavin reductase
MKVALIGITGNVGTRLSAELLRRRHEVTGIARNPDKVSSQPGLTTKRGDVKNETELAQLLAGHDAVIHSVMFQSSDPHKVLRATKKAGVKRLLVVGGAGSLAVAPGKQLVDTPEFPDIYKAEAMAGRDFLNVLRTEKDLDWTFLSPSAFLAPGERTGKFRLGGDELLIGADGESKISMEDFAIALVDELENPGHSRQRFTVGY